MGLVWEFEGPALAAMGLAGLQPRLRLCNTLWPLPLKAQGSLRSVFGSVRVCTPHSEQVRPEWERQTRQNEWATAERRLRGSGEGRRTRGARTWEGGQVGAA